jgi:hypothetical protein
MTKNFTDIKNDLFFNNYNQDRNIFKFYNPEYDQEHNELKKMSIPLNSYNSKKCKEIIKYMREHKLKYNLYNQSKLEKQDLHLITDDRFNYNQKILKAKNRIGFDQDFPPKYVLVINEKYL